MRLIFSSMTKEKSNVVLNSVLLTAAQKVKESRFYDEPEFIQDTVIEMFEELMRTEAADQLRLRKNAHDAVQAIREMADICIVLSYGVAECQV